MQPKKDAALESTATAVDHLLKAHRALGDSHPASPVIVEVLRVMSEGGTPADDETRSRGTPEPQGGRWSLDSTRDWQLRTDIEQLRSGITTMQVLIDSGRNKYGGLDLDSTISLRFCVQSLTQLSETIDELLEAVEVRCKPAPSTEVSESSHPGDHP